MNLEIKDGCLEFPQPGTRHGNSEGGMSLRDWFAGQAIRAVLVESSGETKVSQMAQFAYRLADAMLDARKEPQ